MSDPLPGPTGRLIPSQRIEGTARTTRTSRTRRHTTTRATVKPKSGLSDEQKRLAVMGVVLVLSLLLMVYVLMNRKGKPAGTQPQDPRAMLASLRMPSISNFDVNSLQPDNLSLEKRDRDQRFPPWQKDLFFTPPPPPPEITFHPEVPESTGVSQPVGPRDPSVEIPDALENKIGALLAGLDVGTVIIGNAGQPSTVAIYRSVNGRRRARVYAIGDQLSLEAASERIEVEVVGIELHRVTLRHGDREIPLSRKASSEGSSPPGENPGPTPAPERPLPDEEPEVQPEIPPEVPPIDDDAG